MHAVVTAGTGGYERLELRELPVPKPGPQEVLVRVLAAGVNNTDINTRLGWYSAGVTEATNTIADGTGGPANEARADGGWNSPTPFPLIQGTDCCGRVVSAGSPELADRVGERVLVRPCMRKHGFSSAQTVWMGSDFDGSFAQFVKVPASEVFAVRSDWSDAELGAVPCAYGTAENLIHRAQVGPGDSVLITGASGGVGSAAVQLCKRRNAHVTAICGADKSRAVLELGADAVIAREDASAIPQKTADAVIDVVGGGGFPRVLDAIRPGGRYATSGAVAGPIVSLDLRTLYLRDITLYGATAWDEPVFPDLISYIENTEIRPRVARTFPLAEIARAQAEFLQRRHIGKFVLIPPQD